VTRTTALRVDPANAEQARAWDGDEGFHWADHAQRFDRPGPFALADPGRTRILLASAGFSAITLDALHEPMWFGSDPDDAHRFVLGLMGWMLDGLDDTGRNRALDALAATVTAHASSDGITFASGAWLIRAERAAAETR